MPLKAPEVKDSYGYDYTNELAGEIIAASSWTADAGLTLSDETFDDTSTTVWIEGGEVGQTLTATNDVTTAPSGRELSHVITLLIRRIVNTEDDYPIIAADEVARLAPPPDPLTEDYAARAARAERLLVNYLTQTSGGVVSAKSLSGVGSKTFSPAAASIVRSIVRGAMGSHYTGGGNVAYLENW
jgi:hypothetical protein